MRISQLVRLARGLSSLDLTLSERCACHISEFGGDAKFGLHGDEQTRWTEEYQNAIYREQINMLSKVEFLRGMSPWILYDFHSPRRPLPEIQDYYNRKGLISNDGNKKQAFYTLQKFYKEKKLQKIK